MPLLHLARYLIQTSLDVQRQSFPLRLGRPRAAFLCQGSQVVKKGGSVTVKHACVCEGGLSCPLPVTQKGAWPMAHGA